MNIIIVVDLNVPQKEPIYHECIHSYADNYDCADP